VLTIVLLAMTAILQQKKGRALKTGGHCPIFVRRNRFHVVETGTYWISHQPQKPNSILIGTWLPRIVNWAKLEELETGKRLTVFNTHLDWWVLAHRRSGQILARIINDFDDGSPQIVMGDFNATKESSLYRVLTEQAALTGAPLQDVWENASSKIGSQETYHGGNGEGSFPGRVDHILLRPAAKIKRTVTLEEHTGEIYPSDHFPLLTEIEW
jgi:endonuclease/exonuclease/phosphatase family metal-dependent hydrolase